MYGEVDKIGARLYLGDFRSAVEAVLNAPVPRMAKQCLIGLRVTEISAGSLWAGT